MNHIALIPARAGSKSIINKNLCMLGTSSLVDRAVHSAKEAKFFKKIILSTDIESLIDDYHLDKLITVHRRSSDLCRDESLMSDVCIDSIDSLNLNSSDMIWLLQPTSPFRLIRHFRQIRYLIGRTKAKNVISLAQMGGIHRDRCYSMKNGWIYPMKKTNFKNKQDLEPTLIRNGCFYVFSIGEFKETRHFYCEKSTYGYVMSDLHSINIDAPLDLVLARAVHHVVGTQGEEQLLEGLQRKG